MTDGILRSVTHRRTTTTVPYPMPGAPPAAPLLDDFPNAWAAYSLRKLRTGYAGSAVRIRRSSDNAEADIGFDINGDLDTAAAATHIGGGSGFIVAWYDQSGNAFNITQAVAGSQPLYVASGIGSKPSINFDSARTDNLATGVTNFGTSTTWSVFAVAYTNNASADGRLFSFQDSLTGSFDYDNAASFLFGRNSSNQQFQTYHSLAQRGVISVTYGTANVIAAIYNGTSANCYKDGVAGTGAASSSTMGSTAAVLAIGKHAISGGNAFDGRTSELVVWQTSQVANLAGIDSNIGSYYGL